MGSSFRRSVCPRPRAVEFGSGWGNLTVDLATMGFEVTAVEVEERFCALTERHNRRPDHLVVVRGDARFHDRGPV